MSDVQPVPQGATDKDRLLRWIRYSLEARVILGVPPFLGMIAPLLPVDVVYLFRVPSVLILHWNDAMRWLGSLIGQLPLIPDLSADQVNGLVILTLFLTKFGLLLLFTIFAMISDIQFRLTKEFRRQIGVLSALGKSVRLGLILAFIAVFVWAALSLVSDSPSAVAYSAGIAFVALVFCAQYLEYASFRTALHILVGVAAVLQLFYWLNVIKWPGQHDAALEREYGPPPPQLMDV